MHVLYIHTQVSSSMKDQTLADINTELIKAGVFLSSYAGENLKCLHTFCNSQNIVNWIRETTKGVSKSLLLFTIEYLTCRCH